MSYADQKLIELTRAHHGKWIHADQPGYEELDPDVFWIQFENEAQDKEFLIRKDSKQVSLFFDDWHASFPLEQDQLENMAKMADALLSDRCAVLKLDLGGQKRIILLHDPDHILRGGPNLPVKIRIDEKVWQITFEQVLDGLIFWNYDPLSTVDPSSLN